jgi:amphi-Trp domain-containing protein
VRTVGWQTETRPTDGSITCQRVSRGLEEILFESEAVQTRAEVAAYLRRIADRLDEDGEVTLSAGAESQALSVPARPTFEVEIERETSSNGPAELSLELELELEWDEGAADASLDVS